MQIKKYRSCELLAPGGSAASIAAAADAGCDAVYVGGRSFSARASADNLTDEQLRNTIEELHLRNKRLYLAVNTLVKNSETAEFLNYCAKMYEYGVDAFIVQDYGAMSLLRKELPNAELHASTQMAIGGSLAINYLKSGFGLSRVVLPRELSIGQIADIAKKTDIELECFVHGALCYSYSGLCLMSSMICERSGNRGRCSQSCRLPYRYENGEPEYTLSLKELSAIELLPQLIKAGVASLKLEGRMRSPEYVGAVTGIYRKYLDIAIAAVANDKAYRVDKSDLELLNKIFNRSGSTTGYLENSLGSKMITFGSSSALKNDCLALEAAKACAKPDRIEVDAEIELFVNRQAVLRLSTCIETEKISVEISSDAVLDEAKSRGLDRETVVRQLGKSDSELFLLRNVDMTGDGAVFMPISALNALRREAYSALKEAVLRHNGFSDRGSEISGEGTHKLNLKATSDNSDKACKKEAKLEKLKFLNKNQAKISVCLQNFEQLRAVCRKPYVDRIYIESDMLFCKDAPYNDAYDNMMYITDVCGSKEVFLAMPHIIDETEADRLQSLLGQLDGLAFDGYLIRSVEAMALLKQISGDKEKVADYLMYSMNDEAVRYLYSQGLSGITLPLELNFGELKHICNHIDNECESRKSYRELVIYGYTVAMVSKQCLKRNHNKCDHSSSYSRLDDRKGYRFYVRSFCKSCYNIIYNSKKLFLADMLAGRLEGLGAAWYRVELTNESDREAADILENINEIIYKGGSVQGLNQFSRGHINRGVL